MIAPNILWNLENGLATFRHTGDNIQGTGVRINVLRGLEFVGSQFAVFGPVLFAVLLGAMARIASPAIDRADRLMLAFAIPPLALITVTGMVTRANRQLGGARLHLRHGGRGRAPRAPPGLEFARR